MYVYIRDLKLVRPVTLSFLSLIYTCKADSGPLALRLTPMVYFAPCSGLSYHYISVYIQCHISQCTQPTGIRRSHSLLMLCKHFVDTYSLRCGNKVKSNLL